MIVERLPEVLALSTEEKEILAEELLNQVVLEQDKDPQLLDLLRRRLNEHNADPASGVRWEVLRDRLLSKHKSAARLRDHNPILPRCLNPQVDCGCGVCHRLALSATVSHATRQFRNIDHEYLIRFVPENDQFIS